MIRISLNKKDSKTLKVAFDFNKITLSKIKSIPGRNYSPNDKTWIIPYKEIKKMMDLFDESDLIIEDDVNLDYKGDDRYDFNKEIELLKDERFKSFARYVLTKAPDHFFIIPYGKPGNSLPGYVQVQEGLVNHTRATMKLAHGLSYVHELNDEKHDILLVAALMHDFYKYGEDAKNGHCFEHPLICVDKFEKLFKENLDDLNDDLQYVYNMYWKEIAKCIKSHRGQWNHEEGKDTKLPLPTTVLAKLLHECSFLASRNFIEIKLK